MEISVAVSGLEKWNDLLDLNPRARSAASKAINSTIRSVRAQTAKEIRRQVNFPPSFLSQNSGRLQVRKFATPDQLEARLFGRGRPTSLARFIQGGASVAARKRRKPLAVEVKPGRVNYLRRAFPIRLRQGRSLTETKFNLGVALRLRQGEKLINKTSAVDFGEGLVLLYAPSVYQLLLDSKGRGAFDDISDEAAAKLEAEFLRLLNL